MYKTLTTLLTIVPKETKDLSFEEICVEYRGSLNPSLLALSFSKTFKLILSISAKYYGLTTEDVASLSLERLDKCLRTYNTDLKASFTTYFSVALMNKFREETQSLNTHKRMVALMSDSYDEMVENGFDIIDNEMESAEDLYDILTNLELTARELEYCNYIISDLTNSQIAHKMDVSTMTLSNLRKKLRVKLTPLTLQN